jgi:hypothetical protein
MKRTSVVAAKALMYKAWTRTDTQDWLNQISNRIEDIDYYLSRTVDYCEEHGIWDDIKVFSISFIVIIWVCHMREEEVTRREILEILGFEHWASAEDNVMSLGKHLEGKDFEEILQIVSEFDEKL